MNTSLFEYTNEERSMGLKLLESHRYWSRKRILFNIIVGLCGLASVIIFVGNETTLFDLFGMIVWGFVANGLYSTGYILDSYIISNSRGENSLGDNKVYLFWIGTIAYVIVGFVFVMMYSLPVPI